MILTSPFPSPPEPQHINVHHLFFNRPDQAQWPDYTFMIDATTDQRLYYKQFKEDVMDAITALGSPAVKAGLDITAEEEIVGIMSENSFVRRLFVFFPSETENRGWIRTTLLWCTLFSH